MLWPWPSVDLGQLAPTTLPQCRLVSNPCYAGLSLSLYLAFRSVGFSLSLCVSPTLKTPGPGGGGVQPGVRGGV